MCNPTTKQYLKFSYNHSIDRQDAAADCSLSSRSLSEGVFVTRDGTCKCRLAINSFLSEKGGKLTLSVADFQCDKEIFTVTDINGSVLETNGGTFSATLAKDEKIYVVCAVFDDEIDTVLYNFTYETEGKTSSVRGKEPKDLCDGGFKSLPVNRADILENLSDKIENNLLDAAFCCFADADGLIDNYIMKSLCVTAAINRATLKLPKGSYKIAADEDSPYGLDLSFYGIKNLHLDGCGSTILFTDNFKGGFCFIRSENVTVENLVLDYVNVPWAQGIVTAADEKTQTMTFFLDDDYNIFDDPRFFDTIGAHYGTVRNREDPRLLDANALYYFFLKECKKTASREYEITLSELTPLIGGQITVGDKLVINNRVGCNMSMFDIRESGNVTLKNITVYSCACTGVVGSQMTGPVTVDNFRMTYRPNSALWITSTADGVHLQAGLGKATVINSEFTGLIDDGINLYQWRNLVQAVHSNTRIEIKTDGGVMPRLNDTVEFFDSQKLRLLGVSRVVKIENAAGEGAHKTALLTLENPVEDIKSADAEKPTYMYVQEYDFAGSVIKNNLFSFLRGRGAVLHSADTLVKDNKFINISNHGIHGWYGYEEGLRIRGLSVEDNYFENVGYYVREAESDAGGVISIRLDNSEATVQSTEPFHTDIRVVGNKIKNCHGCAINVGNTERAEISKNVIELDVAEKRYGGETGIKVSYCDAVLENNVFENCRADGFTEIIRR